MNKKEDYQEYLNYQSSDDKSQEEFREVNPLSEEAEILPSRADYHQAKNRREERLSDNHFETQDYSETIEAENVRPVEQRAKYNAKVDRFLNNGIIIVGVLLILVLIIAFLL